MADSNSENHEIRRAGGILAGGTLLSRVLGLVRNQILSHFFGAGIAADAFIAAFTIPNALRRLFGEGGLTPALVSIFTRSLKDEEDSWRPFLSSSFFWLTLVISVICGLGMIFTAPIVFLYVPEFKEVPGKFELTVQLTRYLFPFIILISWAAFFMGILNSFKHFSLPALGPAVSNLCIIIGAPLSLLVLFPETKNGIFIFAGFILLGVFLQLLIQIPKLKKLKALPSFRFNWKDPRVLQLALLLGPSVFSMGIYQLNIIVNRVFASSIDGAVAHLFYADLIVELPVSLIATSMSVASVPSFTRLLMENQMKNLSQSFQYSLNLNALLAIPSTFGILALGFPIVSSIFYTGKFSFVDLQTTADCLFFYSLGLPFFCLMRSLFPLFFAAKDTKTPAYSGLVSLVVNFVAAFYLSRHMGAKGIALSTSIASAVNFFILLIILLRRYPDFAWWSSLKQILKAIVASAVMFVILRWAFEAFGAMPFQNPGVRLDKIALLILFVGLGFSIYFLMARILKLREFTELLKRK